MKYIGPLNSVISSKKMPTVTARGDGMSSSLAQKL